MLNTTANKIETRATFNSLCNDNDVSHFTVNVGLVASERFDAFKQAKMLPHNPSTIDALKIPLLIADIITDFKNIGYSVNSFEMVQSTSEPTLVLTVSRTFAKNTFYDLQLIASKYAQDCIALSNGKKGVLIGEYNYLWGNFNSEFFHLAS